MSGGPLPEKTAAPLLLAAACFDFLVLVCLTVPLASRLRELIPNYQPELVTAGGFFALLFIYWVGAELLFGGRTFGRLILQLNMYGKNGKPATRMQRTTRAIRKITTLGLSGLRLNRLAHYDKKTAIVWTSPLAPRPHRPINEWQLIVDSGPERGKSITFGRTRGFQQSKAIKIGRDPKWSDLPLPKGTNVSSKHAVVLVRDGTLGLMDNGSTNGTFMGGRKLTAKKAVNLSNADSFHIADIKVRIVR